MALWALLHERFGTSVRLARTPGLGYDLHMGHVVEADGLTREPLRAAFRSMDPTLLPGAQAVQ